MYKGVSEKKSVVVWMCTYNHVDFISEAIESVLNQKTDFPFSLVILDDCSTDGTREVCLNYASKYSNIIRLILPSKNTNGRAVVDELYPACLNSGARYIALCEGDDYWTDQYKLQKQVDVLEMSPNCSGCAHNTNVISASEIVSSYIVNEPVKDSYNIDDFTRGEAYFHTSSMLYRIDKMKSVDFEAIRNYIGDWFVLTSMSSFGEIKYINEVMSVYRLHEDGGWSNLSEFEKLSKNLIAIIKYNDYFGSQFESNYLPLFVRRSFDAFLMNNEAFLELIADFEKSELEKIVKYLYFARFDDFNDIEERKVEIEENKVSFLELESNCDSLRQEVINLTLERNAFQTTLLYKIYISLQYLKRFIRTKIGNLTGR